MGRCVGAWVGGVGEWVRGCVGGCVGDWVCSVSSVVLCLFARSLFSQTAFVFLLFLLWLLVICAMNKSHPHASGGYLCVDIGQHTHVLQARTGFAFSEGFWVFVEKPRVDADNDDDDDDDDVDSKCFFDRAPQLGRGGSSAQKFTGYVGYDN